MSTEQACQGGEPQRDRRNFVSRHVHIEKPAIKNEYDEAHEITLDRASRRSGRHLSGRHWIDNMRWIRFRFDRLAVDGLGRVRGGYVGEKALRAGDRPCMFRIFHSLNAY